MNTLLSLPPMVIVTRSVSAPTASTCGGTPGYWAVVKCLVSAAPQVTSTSRAPVSAASTCGKLRLDRRHSSGAAGSDGSTPDAAL
jgi:hypothetical protein